jgi:hypothetical protein
MAGQAKGGAEALPVKEGFRLRGTAMTRIETFTDAAFAFALTLLVVSLDVPASYAELLEALRGVPAFAFSASLLMLFWHGHHAWSRRYGLDDTPTIVLSCLLVFTVLVYVYPLRLLVKASTSFLSQIVGLPTEPFVLSSAAEVNRLFFIYGAGFVVMSGCLVLLDLHAWRRRQALDLNRIERFVTLADLTAWSIVGGVGLLSMLVAVLAPNHPGLPGWTYMILAVVMPIFGLRSGRRRRALIEAGEDG